MQSGDNESIDIEKLIEKTVEELDKVFMKCMRLMDEVEKLIEKIRDGGGEYGNNRG